MINTPEVWQATGDKKTYKQEVDVPEQTARARHTPVPLTLNIGSQENAQ